MTVIVEQPLAKSVGLTLRAASHDSVPRANGRIEEVTRNKGVEIARLTAQLRKAEMMVSSLERQVDQKVSFMRDLKQIIQT